TTAEALQHCLSHMQQHHAAALEKICAPHVEALFDSAGEFVAPLGPIRGADRVARLLVKFVEASPPLQFSFRMLNGMPAALGTSRSRSCLPPVSGARLASSRLVSRRSTQPRRAATSTSA